MSAPNQRHLILAGIVLGTLSQPGTATAAEPGKAAYTLFMGANLELEHHRGFYRVEDVTGSYFQIRIDGKEEMIPTRNGTARMRIDNELKLAGTPLEVADLDAERTYTPARDPRRKFQKESGSAMGAGAAADLSTFQKNMAATNLSAVQQDPMASAAQIANAQSQYDAAVGAESAAYFSMGSDLNSAAYHEQQLEIELAKEEFDAISVSMKLSSPIPLNNPYVLVIARIHERDEKPGVFRNWIFAQKLDPIDTKPSRVFINQGGFPIGYTIEDYQVRIYDHGREIPTNLSPKRVDLTREQAQQYLMIEHLTAHKEDTLPAQPVFGQAPSDLRTRLSSGDYSEPFYVRVDAEGKATGTFTDKDCTQPTTDPYITSFVADVLFVPALEKGKPVPGVARVRLGSLIN